MPLSRIQIEVLKLLAAHRDPESYVAGATPLNLKGPRYSGDIDVFHDREERVAWVVDSDYRFFPTMKDEIFGYILHPVDLAMNKVMAAAGRREVRDLVDLVTIHETILPLGAVIWAVVTGRPTLKLPRLCSPVIKLDDGGV